MATINARSVKLAEAQESSEKLLIDLPELLGNTVPEDRVDSGLLQRSFALMDALLNNAGAAESFLKSPERLRGRQPITDDLLTSYLATLFVTRRNLASGTSVESLNIQGAIVRNLLRDAVKRGERVLMFEFLGLDRARELERDMASLGEQLASIEDRQNLSHVLTEVKAAATKAEASATKASSAAGKASEAALSSYYEKLSKDESEAADRFRKWTIYAGIAAGVTTAIFLVLPEFGPLRIGGTDYAHLLQRVIVTAAIFGMAGYLARQAHQHRSLANWSGALAVQLKTFEAYLDPIEDTDTRNELRRTFAARAFGDHPAMKGEPMVTPSAAAMDTAVGWAAKLTAGGK